MLDEILNNDLCVGCGLCVSLFRDKKGEMIFNENGYLRPSFKKELNIEDTNHLKKICPGIEINFNLLKKTNSGVWGSIERIETGYASDEEIRHSGSSGGVLTAIALYLIKTKIVDFIVQIGQNENNPFENEIKISHLKNDLLRNAGSRYSPSSPLSIIFDIEKKNKPYALIAKPCDIAAIKNQIAVDKDSFKNLKYCLSFFCAGIPSKYGTVKVIEKLGFDIKDNIKNIRYRGNGWPGKFSAVSASGKERSMSYNESWGDILNRYLQFRCKICPDGIGEFADIVCADSWETDIKGYPVFKEEKGKSLIIARNAKGDQLVKNMMNENYINIDADKFLIANLNKIQPYQYLRRSNIFIRLLALKFKGVLVPNYICNWSLIKNVFLQNPWITIKNFFGMYRRLNNKK